MKKILIIIPLVLLVAGGVILMKKRKKEIAQAPLPKPITYAIRTVKASEGEVREQASFLARLAARKQALISSKLSGRITKVLAVESDRVKQGDPLIRIDDAELRASLRSTEARITAAKAQLSYARDQYQRDKALFAAGGLAREKLQASQVAVAQARAALKELESGKQTIANQLSYCNIRAPFAGTIGTVMLRQGDLATPGKPILTLNSDEKKLTFRFSPASHNITPGQEVLWQGRHLGSIATIYDDADQGLSVAEIRPDITLNMPVASFHCVEVVLKRENGCQVPLNSLLHGKNSTRIMVYGDGRFQARDIQVRVLGRDMALISPCPAGPVAVAPEAKLSLLPGHGRVQLLDSKDKAQ